MKIQSHIIQKVNWQITLTSAHNERGICDQVKNEFYRFVANELSPSWDAQVDESEHVVIDKVEIDLGILKKKELRKLLLVQLNNQLTEMVRPAASRSWHVHADAQTTKSFKSILEALDYFLEQGKLPWWYQPQEKELSQEVIAFYRKKSNVTGRTEWNKLKWSPQKIRRLSWQFTNKQLKALLTSVCKTSAVTSHTLEQRVEADFAKSSPGFKKKLLELIISGVLTSEKGTIKKIEDIKKKSKQLKIAMTGFHPEIKRQMSKLIREETTEHTWLNVLHDKPNKQTNKTRKDKPAQLPESAFLTETEQSYFNKEINDILSYGIKPKQKDVRAEPTYIQGAGAVLLWPYLNELFVKLKWINGEKFSSKHKQRKAMALIHFMITGQDNCPEYEMTMSKLLAGWDLQKPIKRNEKLKKKHKKLANQLLQAVIKNWSVLKNTTAQGLQQSFLQRNGKLKKQGADWKLTIEKQSYDMLLSQIPWGYSIIKLPWNNYLLKVDW